MGFFFYLCSSSRRRFSCAFLHLRWTFLWHDTWGNGIAQRKEHKFVILENQILFILWYNITISLMYSIVSLKWVIRFNFLKLIVLKIRIQIIDTRTYNLQCSLKTIFTSVQNHCTYAMKVQHARISWYSTFLPFERSQIDGKRVRRK